MTAAEEQRLDLACAYRILAHHNVIDAYGHVSVRSASNPNRYLLAKHLAPQLVTPDDILEYDLDTRMDGKPVYTGQTSFGFFPKEALARQVGLSEAKPWKPDPGSVVEFLPVPEGAFLPRDRWRMLDTHAWLPAGGPEGLGWLEGRVEVDPGAWFFSAHFYQDPVWPGSLGLEAFLQLMQYDCLHRWVPGVADLVDGSEHRWVYRGQVTPGIRHVTVMAEITARDENRREVEARG